MRHGEHVERHLEPAAALNLPLPPEHTVMVYVYEGLLEVGGTDVKAQHLLRLSKEGDLVVANTGEVEARFLILAGKPLREPVAQYGPFVMNTHEEIEQALTDYRNGTFTTA